MDTDLLRAFVTTAEIKNFTKAATRLARTQSALSLQIRRLEDQLGVVLLHRDRRGVGLTSAGEVFLVHARHLLAVEDEAIRSVQRTRADEDLRLGIPDAYSSILLPGTVHALAELHPDARVHVTCAISTSLVTHFEHGELDLIVIIKHDHAPAGQVLCEEALLWVASRALHLDTQQPVPLALFPEPCLYRAHALRALAAARRDWQVVYTSQSTSAINIAIDEGWAVALKTPSTTHTNWQTLDATDHMPPLDPVRLELRIAPGRQSPALQTLRNLLATEAQRRIVHASSHPRAARPAPHLRSSTHAADGSRSPAHIHRRRLLRLSCGRAQPERSEGDVPNFPPSSAKTKAGDTRASEAASVEEWTPTAGIGLETHCNSQHEHWQNSLPSPSSGAYSAHMQLADVSQRVGHFIDGEIDVGANASSLPVFNPALGREVRRVACADAACCARAVAAAAQALPAWADMPSGKRAQVLFRFRTLLLEQRQAISAALTDEHGKVLADAQAELQRGLEVLEFACGIASALRGQYSAQAGTDIDTFDLRQPVGVVLGITPFNFPAMVPLWMAPIALACGNTFILKPSEKVPSAALFLAQLLREAGAPSGVFNVVQGDKGTVEALLDAPEVAAVSFVGSTPVAQQVYTRAVARGARCQALGGAKNHLVVLPDADLDEAADALVGAAFGAAGERCMAVSVAVAVGDIAAPLLDKVQARAEALRVRPGTDPTADMGPLITATHRDRVHAYVASGLDEGATLRLDGRHLQVDSAPEGFFMGPTILDHVHTGMQVYQEEIFGPVLCCIRVASPQDALALVNRHRYGNGVALYTRDGHAARHFSRRVQAGMVGINVPIPVPVASHSFGGWKQSLFGDHAIYGPEGVHFYTRLKTVTQRWRQARAGAELSMPVSGA